MEKINVAELLKNCPRDMKLDCTMYDNLYFDQVCDEDDCLYPIGCYTIADEIRTSINFTEFGGFNTHVNPKCVIFPEGKTTWAGFVPPCKFNDGDIIFVVNNKSDEDFQYESIAIFKEMKNNKDIYVHGVYSYNDDIFSTHPYLCEITNSTIIKFATEEQKEKLFNLIKINGYNWNPVTKTFEDLTEPKFKNGDIIVCESARCTFISIFKENAPQRKSFIGHCVFDIDDNKLKVKDSASYFNKARFATKREKERLFVAIERNGYQWNPKTKTLEKLPNKFDITTLKPFESKVLVWDDALRKWIPAFWGSKCDSGGYITTYGWCKYCIPFDGNEHLLDTSKDCDKFYKTWK